MKKYVYSFPVKAAAVFLLTLAAATAGLFGTAAVVALEASFYSVSDSAGGFQAAMATLRENGWITKYMYDNMTAGPSRNIYEFIFHNRYSSIFLAALGLLAFLALLVYLLRAAGRRGGSPEIVLGPLDRVPFDLTLAAGITVMALSVLMAAETHGVFEVVYGVAALALCLLTVLYILYTFAARVKAGGWWRNTLVYMVLRFLWRTLRAFGRFLLRLLRAIRMEWRVALAAIGFIVVDLCAFVWAANYEPDMGLLLLAVLYPVSFATVTLGAWQFRKLKRAGEKLAAGELDYKVDTGKLFFDYRRHGENLNSIGEGMSAAVDQRMRSERLKTELITNVSHDIKTPLTSIVNYVDLLQKPHTPEEGQQYLEVLARQSDKLRRLTLDLVEASKASTGNLPCELVPTNTAELVHQAAAEYADRFAAGQLESVVTMPEKPVTVLADGRHLWRVLDNLFNNAVKYAQPGTRVYIDVRRMDGRALLSVKNISRERLNVSSEELMERFVRGDQSRHTEGSGLGLSIARSLTELMGGTFGITIDGDLFKAEIRLELA